MKQIIYSIPNGQVAAVIPSPNFLGEMDELALKTVPVGTSFLIVDERNLPDRTFRAAWRIGENGIDQDIEVAKLIWRNKWREVRAKLFEKLDTDMLRAIGSGDSAKIAEIEGKKQVLRDVTQTTLPNSITGIQATWPEILGDMPV